MFRASRPTPIINNIGNQQISFKYLFLERSLRARNKQTKNVHQTLKATSICVKTIVSQIFNKQDGVDHTHKIRLDLVYVRPLPLETLCSYGNFHCRTCVRMAPSTVDLVYVQHVPLYTLCAYGTFHCRTCVRTARSTVDIVYIRYVPL